MNYYVLITRIIILITFFIYPIALIRYIRGMSSITKNLEEINRKLKDVIDDLDEINRSASTISYINKQDKIDKNNEIEGK